MNSKFVKSLELDLSDNHSYIVWLSTEVIVFGFTMIDSVLCVW